jgi:pyruvate dehydrogenase kinase 2/3/4
MTINTMATVIGMHARGCFKRRMGGGASVRDCRKIKIKSMSSISINLSCNFNDMHQPIIIPHLHRRQNFSSSLSHIHHGGGRRYLSHIHHGGGRRYLSASSSTQPTGGLEEQADGSSQQPPLSLSLLGPKISMDELLALASCQPTALSLEAMYLYAPKRRSNTKLDNKQLDNESRYVDISRLRNAQFLHKELPIRIAQRAIDLLTLPHGLNRTREVQAIANTYLQYLQQLRDFPVPTNKQSEKEFTNILNSIVLDRHSIPMAIAKGLQSLKDDRKAPVDVRRLAEMEEALNRFFTARVGLRFLVEHHVLSGNDENSDALYRKQLEAEGGLELLEEDKKHESMQGPDDECCGAIQKNCDPIREVRRTVARVQKLCRESYGIVPEIEVVDCISDKDAALSFTYVPHHLRYMLAELLKNSCRAEVRNYLGGSTQKEDHVLHGHTVHDAPSLPPIRVVVTKGAEDVTIKISDRGGGMPRSIANRIWTFALSKEGKAREDKHEFGKDEFTGGHIRGFGLPLARIYARYFGGEVTIKSMVSLYIL